MEVTILEEKNDGRKHQWLVKAEDGRYAIISSIDMNEDGEPETLVFPHCGHDDHDHGGQDVAGGANVSMQEALEDLKGVLDGEPRRYPRPGPVGRMLDHLDAGNEMTPELALGALEYMANQLLPSMALKAPTPEFRRFLVEFSDLLQPVIENFDMESTEKSKEVLQQAVDKLWLLFFQMPE